jgi:hypothetical protein
MAGCGSAWAWSVCRRLGVDETWPRMKFLLYGWLFATGTISAIVFLFMSIMLCIYLSNEDWRHRESFPVGFLACVALGSLLLVPGIRTERACRKKMKTTAEPPPKTPAQETT